MNWTQHSSVASTWGQEKDYLPWPPDNASPNTTQEAVGLHYHEGCHLNFKISCILLLSHVDLLNLSEAATDRWFTVTLGFNYGIFKLSAFCLHATLYSSFQCSPSFSFFRYCIFFCHVCKVVKYNFCSKTFSQSHFDCLSHPGQYQ